MGYDGGSVKFGTSGKVGHMHRSGDAKMKRKGFAPLALSGFMSVYRFSVGTSNLFTFVVTR